MKSKLTPVTIDNFKGGWNVADSDLNLSSQYQPVSDNVIRGSDGSFQCRFGTDLFADLGVGDEVAYNAQAVTLTYTNTSPVISIQWTSHPFSDGEHISISSISGIADPHRGIAHADFYKTFGVYVVDANNFKIALDTAATSSGSDAATIDCTHDDHLIGGDIITMHYFNNRMVMFSDIGEICTFDTNGSLAKIWDHALAVAATASATITPTRRCKHWSSTTNKNTIIACNGYDKDKPIQIFNDFTVDFLVDKASLSNAAVPKADWVLSMHSYVIFARTEYGNAFTEISAIGTDGTFTREAIPGDSVEKDVSLVTDTVDPTILGISRLRNKILIAFYDRAMIGTLGIYDSGGNHTPDYNDTVAEHGTVSQRTMVPMGNDLLMADFEGIPSVALSQFAAQYIPSRVSELIGPTIRSHLSKLANDTLRHKTFSVFNKNERAYMFFVPNADEVAKSLEDDPFYFNEQLSKNNLAYMRMDNHGLLKGMSVTISGAVDVDTQLTAANINGVRQIVNVVDENGLIVQLNSCPLSITTTSGGGGSVTATPVQDETICYHYEYNNDLKINRWTRLRGMNFTCGATSQRSTLFFAKGKKVYRYGSRSDPNYADFLNDYDSPTVLTSQAIAVGTRVKNHTGDGNVYICIKAHTATGSPTDYASDVSNWEPYKGEPIDFILETPWSDLSRRDLVKNVKYVSHDTKGVGQFTFSFFTEQLYKDPNTHEPIPNRSMQFSCGDTGGFGVEHSGTWGSGRRTRDQTIWPMETRAKQLKLRYEGSTRELVRIISTTLYYTQGSIRR